MIKSQTIALILASGEGSRFDGIKQLAPIDNTPMLVKVFERLNEVCGETVVVLGAYSDEISKVLDQHDISYIINSDWKSGMASSITFGVTHIETSHSESKHILISLGDQPFIEKDNYRSLLNASADHPGKITAAGYQGIVGVPAVFPQRYWPELLSLKGDKGARKLLRNTSDVVVVNIPEAGRDIDTAADLT